MCRIDGFNFLCFTSNIRIKKINQIFYIFIQSGGTVGSIVVVVIVVGAFVVVGGTVVGGIVVGVASFSR